MTRLLLFAFTQMSNASPARRGLIEDEVVREDLGRQLDTYLAGLFMQTSACMWMTALLILLPGIHPNSRPLMPAKGLPKLSLLRQVKRQRGEACPRRHTGGRRPSPSLAEHEGNGFAAPERGVRAERCCIVVIYDRQC